MTYNNDIDRNEINALEHTAGHAGGLWQLAESKTSERAALIEAVAAFRERAARLAESGHAATCHPHEQARVHHRIGADSARKSIAAKIRALPLFESEQSHDGYFAVPEIDLCEHGQASPGEIDSAKRHLIIGGEL